MANSDKNNNFFSVNKSNIKSDDLDFDFSWCHGDYYGCCGYSR